MGRIDGGAILVRVFEEHLMRPITKWAHRITHAHRIGDLLAQRLRVATPPAGGFHG